MDFLNKLLLVAVLTGPLWLLLILLPLAIWIAVKAAKRFERRSAKIAIGLLAFLLVFFVPFADEIAGRSYLNYLCATQAGVKVYQSVELPAEYWDEQGKPKFFNEKNGNFNLEGFKTDAKIEKYSPLFRIQEVRFSYLEGKSGKVLGKVTSYQYTGGWVQEYLSPAPGGGATCDLLELRNSQSVVLSIFKPVANQHK
jgi:hypothetical protein